uniref:Uncharacterized protein n=1 Tax=Timema douglasi TaxID=61478 RepID=A0A7R8VMM4_TIMDO|nr:unnamed protein product [Timema douglasi]
MAKTLALIAVWILPHLSLTSPIKVEYVSVGCELCVICKSRFKGGDKSIVVKAGLENIRRIIALQQGGIDTQLVKIDSVKLHKNNCRRVKNTYQEEKSGQTVSKARGMKERELLRQSRLLSERTFAQAGTIATHYQAPKIAERGCEIIPENLHISLREVMRPKIGEECAPRKRIAFANSIVAATRPKSFVSPEQVGKFVYRTLIDIVASIGVSAGHKEVNTLLCLSQQAWEKEHLGSYAMGVIK